MGLGKMDEAPASLAGPLALCGPFPLAGPWDSASSVRLTCNTSSQSSKAPSGCRLVPASHIRQLLHEGHNHRGVVRLSSAWEQPREQGADAKVGSLHGKRGLVRLV